MKPRKDNSSKTDTAIGAPRPWLKEWALRLTLVVLAPLLFLGLLEGSLRLLGFGWRTSFLLPMQDRGRTLLVQNDRFAWKFLGRDMARQPFPLAIPVKKAPETVRVFVLGESAAYGDPQPEFGLSRMLEALLSLRYPGTNFEVVNAALTGINSHAIREVARSCAKADSDIWVLYMGNNEVVGPFGPGTVFGSQTASLPFIRTSLGLRSTRTGQALDGLIDAVRTRPLSRREWGGMQMFIRNRVRRDDPRMKGVYEHFERNLHDIIESGRGKGVAIIASTVASNLKDCAPFASVHRAELSADELQAWEKQYRQGIATAQAGKVVEAIDYFRAAERIDGTFAELSFRLGTCHLSLGRNDEATKYFITARDQDALRFRADSRLNGIIRDVTSGREKEGIRLIDGERLLAQYSTNGICGREFLLEHVHLNFSGNYLLARAIAEQIGTIIAARAAPKEQTAQDWPSLEECASRLAFTPFAQQRGLSTILTRLQDPPFTMQINAAEQYSVVVRELQAFTQSLRLESLHQAEQTCSNALTGFPNDWVLYRELALIQQKLGLFSRAAGSLRKVAGCVPASAESWQMLGEVLFHEDKLVEATAAFREVLKLDPADVPASSSLAEIYLRQGEFEKATKTYQEVLRRKPYWPPAHLGLAKVYDSTARKAEADAHYRKAIETPIRTPTALSGLAKMCFDRGWYQEALTNFSLAVELAPTDAASRVNLGLTLASLGRRPEARKQYAEAVQLDPNLVEARVRFGVELGREGKDAEALEQFAAAVKLRPEMWEARLNLGIALMKERRQNEAFEQFKEVLRLNPTNATALKYLSAASAH